MIDGQRQVVEDRIGMVGDHCWNPHAVLALAEQRGWLVDEVSLNAIIGRWVMDYRREFDDVEVETV